MKKSIFKGSVKNQINSFNIKILILKRLLKRLVVNHITWVITKRRAIKSVKVFYANFSLSLLMVSVFHGV